MGRIDDWKQKKLSSFQVLSNIKTIFKNYHFSTKILSASIRQPEHIIESAKIGVDVVTASLKLLCSLIKHPLTDAGIQTFIQDYTNNQSN